MICRKIKEEGVSMYEELLKNIRKYARDNNLNENDTIYIERLNNTIVDFSFSFREGMMKEKLGDIIWEMEEK